MRAIGFLRSTSRAASEYVVAAFREGLKEAGFDEDRNVVIEFRYADDQIDRLPPLVAEDPLARGSDRRKCRCGTRANGDNNGNDGRGRYS